jgi:Rod binding domain-containing protein
MVYKVPNAESLAIEITEILNQSFNSTLTKEDCIGIAQQIWEQIRE